MYFLFSAYVPYFMVTMGMLMCGKLPEEYYTEEFADMEFVDTSFLTVMVVIASIIMVLYLLAWLFSKKQRVGWLVFALVMFSLDTMAMMFLGGFSAIIDILFHGWFIFSLSRGIYFHCQWKKAALNIHWLLVWCLGVLVVIGLYLVSVL